MYVVVADRSYRCPCLDKNDIADPACPLCLGMGYKIKIRKILGVVQPGTPRTSSDNITDLPTRYYYFDAAKINQEYIHYHNIIVRGNEVDILQNKRKFRSDSEEIIYYYVESVPKKLNKDIFLKNFYKLVGKTP